MAALTPQEALIKTKIALMNRPDSAFFTTLCLSFDFIWDSNVPRACTDGIRVWLNPESWMKLTPGQRLSRLMHETLHPALQHIEMMQTKRFNNNLLNIAGDYYINNMLISKGYERIPTWYVDPRFNGMTTLQIYKIIEQEEKDKPGTHPSDEEQNDLKLPQVDQQYLKRHIDDILVRASIQARMEGQSVPDGMQIYIDNLLNPKLPWGTILRKYMQSFAQNDYSTAKFSRKYLPKFYLPTLWSRNIISMDCFMDGSLSVTDHEFNAMATEIYQVVRSMRPESINLSVFDDEVKSTVKIKSAQQILLQQFKARGGTNIWPVLQKIIDDKPQLALIFSDGEFDMPNHLVPKNTDVIWLIYNDKTFTAPFGKVIHYEI